MWAIQMHSDIGTHWMDAVQTVTGAKIVEACADLHIVLPTRKKPKTQVETFSNTSSDEYEEADVKTEIMEQCTEWIMVHGGILRVRSNRTKMLLNFEIDEQRPLYMESETAIVCGWV